jgi:melibiose permease/lactose/raffinose/galactose permease
MLLFLADTVDYGHWKLGKRNESVTFSLQPFIYKAGGAAATGIVGFTAILVRITGDNSQHLIDGNDLTIFKVAMFVLPLVCILAGYLIFHFKYTINEERYAEIHRELVARGDLKPTDAVVSLSSSDAIIDAAVAFDVVHDASPAPDAPNPSDPTTQQD